MQRFKDSIKLILVDQRIQVMTVSYICLLILVRLIFNQQPSDDLVFLVGGYYMLMTMLVMLVVIRKFVLTFKKSVNPS